MNPKRLIPLAEPYGDPCDVPAGTPLTLASDVAGPRVETYLEHLGVGHTPQDMPLFVRPDRYVYVPLEATYQSTYRGVPAFWREVLEGKPENEA